MEIVEDSRATSETLIVIARIGADAIDKRLDTRRFLASEFVVLEIDVVDDFRDRRQRRIVQTCAREQHFKAAAVAFVRELGGWIAIADLVVLMDRLGVDEQAVRSAVSRYARRGLLERVARDDRVGYALSEPALRLLEEGDLRIYERLRPASVEDGWVLATFSIPEDVREERHQLRTRLTWLGFGNLGAGVWIAPRRVLERAVAAIADLGLEGHVDVFAATYEAFDRPERLVRRCWDLDRLAAVYTRYVDEFGPLRDRWADDNPRAAPAEAYADFVQALHEWRKTPYLDPGLPTVLLPAPWPGTTAAGVFSDLRARLEGPATAFVAEVVAGARR